jgi:signal transduction histidine kinase
MSEEFIQNQLFKPFQTTKKKGLGIGLYQCKEIITAHGGAIEVRSKQHEGTSFKIQLPISNGHLFIEDNQQVKFESSLSLN